MCNANIEKVIKVCTNQSFETFVDTLPEAAAQSSGNMVIIDHQHMSCVICLNKTNDQVVLPCAHMCMCSDCALSIKNKKGNCPVCDVNIEKVINVFTVSGHPGERIVRHRCKQYIKSKMDDRVYSYFAIGVVFHKDEKPITDTEFDTIDFNMLTYPSPQEHLANPQLVIGYVGDKLIAQLENGYYDKNGFPQTKVIKSIEISPGDAAKLIIKLSKVYKVIDVFGNMVAF